MNKHLVLLLAVLLAVQVKAKLSPRDLVDEARNQLDELGSLVQGNILAAHNELSNVEVDFLTNSDNTIQTGVVSIQLEHESINEQLTIIKEFADAINTDITACTDIREELLGRLPDEFNNQIKNCIFGINREEARLVSDTKYIVDVVFNKVQTLEFRFTQCREDFLCISPLMTDIQLDKVRLPQNIKTEVQAIEGYLTTLRISTQDCSDAKVSDYTANAMTLLKDITECANRIMG